jgi:hypothetical protein
VRLPGALQVNSVLDRKEALLQQLRTMNDEAEADMHLDSSGRHTEAFQATYAQVVLELKQACLALFHPCPCITWGCWPDRQCCRMLRPLLDGLIG